MSSKAPKDLDHEARATSKMASSMNTQHSVAREDTAVESNTFKCFQCSFVCSHKDDLHLHMRDVQCCPGFEGNVSSYRGKLKNLKNKYTVKDTAQLMYNRVVCRTGRNPNVTRKIIATNYSGVTKKQSDERSIDCAVKTSNPTKHKQEQKRYKQTLRGGNVTSKDGANISRIPFPTFKKQTVTVNVRHADKLRRVLEQEGSRNRFTNILRIKMWKRLMELGSTKQPTVKVKRRRVEEKKKLLEIPCTQQVLLHGSSYRMITADRSQNLTGAYSSGLGNNCSATAKEDAGDARRPSFPQGTGTVSSCVPIDLRVRPTTTQSSTTRDEEVNLLRSGPPRFRNVRAEYFGQHAVGSPEYTRQRSLAGALREVERCVCSDCRPAFLAGVQTIARCHAELRRETQSRSVINQ